MLKRQQERGQDVMYEMVQGGKPAEAEYEEEVNTRHPPTITVNTHTAKFCSYPV